MSNLIEAMMERFIFLEKTRVKDGEGGFITTWKDGAEFMGAIGLNTTMEARIAESAGVTSIYTITTKKNVPLEFHEVIKRVSDGAIFRITSNGNDQKSPNFSSIDMCQASAEKWSLPR